MIRHVYEKAKQVTSVKKIIVATDDQRIITEVNSFGGQALLTDKNHLSGTERIVEISKNHEFDFFINIQGDEPLVNPSHIDDLIGLLEKNPDIDMATIYHEIDEEEAKNINFVKLILDNFGNAIYFSRSLIPFNNYNTPRKYLKHIGVYAYSNKLLSQYNSIPSSDLEVSESLEQLKFVSQGIKIKALKVDKAFSGVDTPECLKKIIGFFD